ncbi:MULTISPECIES: Tex family protein [unclassified Thermoactinomyces]|jgi:protein Tex|uniref:Tex family protein n=1 Tax=unclassified Thermoactinomyces TaxID=2634588 RepID=UPI0018DE246C|nr:MULTISPECIES: Tex family protein [unclassified Thermoactinomyces]MBH8599530.1 RNA-binding transcriptional accessory protein [Thermoactinomyces sp. CICC 10523]MBH8605449.1 RNA-binding transcriptional accessory protein [Thermoactinomyces sp. CICC 10522]
MDQLKMMEIIAGALGIETRQVKAAIELMEEGNTIPFIARYRKERTGELDEEQLRSIEERYQYATQLNQRKEEVIRLIDEQGKLTDELRQKIMEAVKLQEVEDLYLPYRPKRKTRASIAREKGLEPLARIMLQVEDQDEIEQSADEFVSEENEVNSREEALQGAMDILAEELSEDAEIRKWVREFTWKTGMLVSKAKDPEVRSVYEMYYEFSEPVHKMPSHRILAVNRGEREEILKVKITVDEEEIHRRLLRWFPIPAHDFLQAVAQDSYKRLIAPSIEREVRAQMTEQAEEQAIRIFSENLRHLLLQPPVRGKMVLGVDPAYRTGCKWAVVADTGKMLEVGVIYPTPPQEKVEEAKRTVLALLDKYPIEIIAIGNGTASRETEAFIASVIKEAKRSVYYIIVNEAGASVYSASKLAKEEFPDLDAARRSAVSIARRLQDPLAELVKIDPKSVGVGQYQHDVSQKRLSESLTTVVESAVNYVGVDVNTASPALLGYVSGISASVAKNIVKRRDEVGRFQSREELKEVPRLGAKTYEQCIGFLRIHDGVNPLDQTPIHPESYRVADQLLQRLEITKEQIGSDECKEKLKRVDVEKIAAELDCGIPTLRDIIEALLRPGRDPRDELPKPLLRSDVLKLEDLHEGMHLQGTVRNVVDFGAFVDIGLKHDGLVHISKMSEKFVRNPMDIVTVGDIVDVWVINVDVERERVGLSMIPVKREES